MFARTLVAAAAAVLVGNASAALVGADALVINGFNYGSTSIDTTLTGYVGTGRLSGERTVGGVTTSFLTYCTDLFQHFNWGVTYTDYMPVANGAEHGFTVLQAALLGKLYTGYGNVVSTLTSTAFQLAVWEIVNEADGAPLSLTGGNFAVQAGGTGARVLADGWLQAIVAADAPSLYNAQRLYSATAQDFVVFSELPRNPGGTDTDGRIPEPASLALAGMALAGLAASRRRRSLR